MVKELGLVAGIGVAVIGGALGAALLGSAVRPNGGEFQFSFNGNDASPGQAPAATSATSKEWDWSGGDKITLNVPASVRVEEGVPARVIVHGDSETIAQLTFANWTLSNRQLRTKTFRNSTSRLRQVQVILRGIPLNTFNVYGSDKIELGHIDQDKLNIHINGNSNVEAEGRADAIDIRVAGSGKLYFGKLAAKTVTIDISGTGNAEVAPTAKLNASIRGSGEVRLFSRPQDLETNISGQGQIIQTEAGAPSQMESGDLQLGPPDPPLPPEPPSPPQPLP